MRSQVKILSSAFTWFHPYLPTHLCRWVTRNPSSETRAAEAALRKPLESGTPNLPAVGVGKRYHIHDSPFSKSLRHAVWKSGVSKKVGAGEDGFEIAIDILIELPKVQD